jgi:hypothetical protein
MDCTTMGAPPPMVTGPIFTPTLARLEIACVRDAGIIGTFSESKIQILPYFDVAGTWIGRAPA